MSIWQRFPDDRLLADVSLWSANLAMLSDEIKRMEPYADVFHLDVSDNHFATGLLFFPDLVATIRPLTNKPFHVHLMVEHVLSMIDAFAAAGADIISVHYENGSVVPAALERIRAHGKATGLAFGLDVQPDAIISYLHSIDLVVMMSTPLGIKGQELSEHSYARIRSMRQLIQAHATDQHIKISNDGGNRYHTVPNLRRAGVDMVVMGSLAFNSSDLDATFRWLWTLPQQ